MGSFEQRHRNRKAIGGVPRGYVAPLPPVRKERENYRESGRLDAMDICYGETATREPYADLKAARNKRKGGDERYTAELLEAAWVGYREGFERYMRDYGHDGHCLCSECEGQTEKVS